MSATTPNDLTILYALSTEARLGPRVMAALLAHCEDPQTIWESGVPAIAEFAKLSEDATERLTSTYSLIDSLQDELEHITNTGTELISIIDRRYPARLQRLSDPPTILYVRGQLPDPAKTSIAVVGTHQADADGIANAVEWGKGLAERDTIVVSGLARGIDGGGHTGAVASGGTTVAVLGCGFNNIYPPEHAGLAEEIQKDGALLSEYPPREYLTKPRLIRRNRIIVGLADAVVVVRVHLDSKGSMEAIRRARDLAVPVFLVAADSSRVSQVAVSEGAISIKPEPDFDLVLKYL